MAAGISPAPEERPEPKIDGTVPHSARIWNYWLGGKDNFEIDREVGDQVVTAFPAMIEAARESRAMLRRVVRYLARDVGIRQFLDVGTGLPTAENTHQVAQAVAPESRIVYVDNDPVVLVHARALLTSHPDGATDYIEADLRDTGTILREAARTLDLTRPVALILMGILAHVDSYDQARAIVRQLLAGLPSGSYLVAGDATDTSNEIVEAARIYNETGDPPVHLRSPEQIAGYFEGLELVEPGVVSAPRWRPESTGSELPPETDGYGGVARKP